MDTIWITVMAAAAGVLLIAGLGVYLLYTRRRAARHLMSRIGELSWRGKVRLAGELLRDERVPLGVRIVMPLLALYLVMPIDLIPDFIPIIGQLDDLALIILVAGLLLRAMPMDVINEHIDDIQSLANEPQPPRESLPEPRSQS